MLEDPSPLIGNREGQEFWGGARYSRCSVGGQHTCKWRWQRWNYVFESVHGGGILTFEAVNWRWVTSNRGKIDSPFIRENLGVQIWVASGDIFFSHWHLKKTYFKCWVLVLKRNVFCSLLNVTKLRCEVIWSLYLGQLSFLAWDFEVVTIVSHEHQNPLY